MTSGSEENDPKLKWCLECWKAFKKTLPWSEDKTNNKPSDLNDLNILSGLRNQVSNKKSQEQSEERRDMSNFRSLPMMGGALS